MVVTKQGKIKNSIGDGEVKEFTCMTHGHELSGGMLEGGRFRAERDEGEKKYQIIVIA